jgi:hypothetical protein
MPLSELGRRLQNQAPQRRFLKYIFNARDGTNMLARRVKTMRIQFVKKHTQISINQLRDRK